MYDPESEKKWNTYWKENEMFLFDETDRKKPIFIIDTPPPNTTGELHMGQVYWISYIDSIARYKRFKGYNVLYPQGWDTQGFPVELQVEKDHKGLSKEEFYNKCVEYATKNLNKMKEQMLEMGASFDDRYEYVTMSDDYHRKIQLSLIEMQEKGLIYLADHPVEWCPHCKSSISREESDDVEKNTTLNYIEFKFDSKEEKSIIIATTRPELLHACVAIMVNPSDERYNKLIGKEAIVPIFGQKVKVFSDESIDKDFGTGAEMVCTFGDKHDAELYYKYNLRLIKSIDDDGRLINAGKYEGLSIKEARSAIIDELRTLNLLSKQDNLKHSVKIHDRCSSEIEIISSLQWFVKTKEFSGKLKEYAKQIKWTPANTIQKLFDWADYIEWDWNISRNRVFGTPIPFWYCSDCHYILAADKEKLPINTSSIKPPIDACPKCGSHNLVGEEKVCDVWVDSSITPMIIAGWPDNKELFKRAFPVSVRIQGVDIIRTWAFYTTLRTMLLTDNKPFENLLLNGMILGKDGREMHKSFGNGVNPRDAIKQYSIDSIRLWVAISGDIGSDKKYSDSLLNYSKSFILKVYNSAMFIKNLIDKSMPPEEPPPKGFELLDIWIINRFNEVVKEADKYYSEFNLYGAAMALVNFYWYEFCDYYIEDVKYRVYSDGESISKKAALYTLNYIMSNSLVMLAPIIPHAAEEINSLFSDSSVFNKKFPEYKELAPEETYTINGYIFKSSIVNIDYINAGKFVNQIITDVRKEKAQRKLALNAPVKSIKLEVPETYYEIAKVSEKDLKGILNADKITLTKSNEYSLSLDL
ncbi:valyl-tRNA synthetase [Candidatus Mancarchaeum acidiphilum]|uniref:Valine--tRNA ligase n=1 Tax=Candidatus Mancarchaeum acidiphilum TaxID=1920749 RepID=A0A218NLZ9_9ARCH|nr:valine--tRNA ligase [Candidatus Mancarchaeum acidiphilum]ASI13495.1 valyl-tRNA synthetase [Candidatus Mancarchaeum acidiphilum]